MTKDFNNDLMPDAIVILAGGQSRRMGSAKALLSLPTGQRLLDYHVDAAKIFDCPILIADNDQGFFTNSQSHDCAKITQISDYQPKGAQDQNQGGALVAILGAMQVLQSLPPEAWLLVISCDSLISAPMLWQKLHGKVALVNKTNQADIVCLNGHKIVPLLGAYRLSLANELQTYLDRGERRVMPFITPKVNLVDSPHYWQALANFNSATDFENACQAFYHLKLLSARQ